MVLEKNNIDELVAKIESARVKLNAAVGHGLEEKSCYLLSKELDELIERYIDLMEASDSSGKDN